MRRRFLILLAGTACAVLALAPAGRAAVPVLVIDGRGYGHGVGMAQDGAYWMGRAGSTTNQILGAFYPGTSLGKAGGTVRVAVFGPAGGGTILTFPNGGDVRDAPDGPQSGGFPVEVEPGGQVVLSYDGSRYVVQPGSGAHISGGSSASGTSAAPAAVGTAPSPSPTARTAAASDPTTTTLPTPTLLPTTTTTEPPTTTTTGVPASPGPAPAPAPATQVTSTQPLWAVPAGSGTVTVAALNRTYRGTLEALAAGAGLRFVNQVDVETYLKGMGEVQNPSWPAASLRAQAIAARTYALRAMSTAGELCDDQRCQVYLGAQAEYAAMNKAVNDTAHQVVVYNRGLASTVYSANGGAFSATRQEGFGTDDAGYPYLRAAPYLTKDPEPWSVTVALSDVAARFGYRGAVSGVTVSQAGPSGRAIQVEIDGTAGPKAVTGLSFAADLGLHSNLFTLRTGTADTAPAAPAPGGPLQELPDQAGAAAADPAPVAAGVPVLPPLFSPPLLHHTDSMPSGTRALVGIALMLNVAALGAVVARWLRKAAA